MKYLDFESKYNKYPETRVVGYDHQAWKGWKDIGNMLQGQ